MCCTAWHSLVLLIFDVIITAANWLEGGSILGLVVGTNCTWGVTCYTVVMGSSRVVL